MKNKQFLKEFLIATALFGLCSIGIFRDSLLHREVLSLQAQAAPASLTGFGEMLYELQSALFAQTRIIQGGFFPDWSPYSQGGSPLIGKMQNGVFAPYHLPLYVFPMSWLPYLFMLVLLIKYYLAFIFTYLYARSMLLGQWSGIAAGIIFLVSHVAEGLVFAWNGSGLYLPLALLLVELYFRGRRQLAQFLLPWVIAFSFFSGHFESSFYLSVVTGVYFMAHLWKEKAPPQEPKLPRFAGFCGLLLLGVLISSVQIIPALEYVKNSYNNVWHTSAWFPFWEYQTIFKHLGAEDLPLMAASFICLFLSVKFIPGKPGKKIAASCLLALALAGLANLGLDDSLQPLSLGGSVDLLNWSLVFLFMFLSFWNWSQDNQPFGLKILGALPLGSILLMHKVPPFPNLLLHLPLTRHFHNGVHRWEFYLALSVHIPAALERLHSLTERGREEKIRAAAAALSILCICLFGYIGSQYIKGTVAWLAPTGLSPMAQKQGGGGIMGPEHLNTYGKSIAVTGWVPASGSVSSVAVGVMSQDNKILSAAQAAVAVSGDRLYFHASVPIPRPGVSYCVAQVKHAGGKEQILRGAEMEAFAPETGPLGSWILPLLICAFPLIFFCGPRTLVLLGALFPLLLIGRIHFQTIPAREMPYRLPGVEAIRADGSLFRTASLQYNFMQADYPNVYGLSDLRPGGDNLDVLTMIYFSQIAGNFLADAKDSAALDTHLRLLGLGNVKYLMNPPGAGGAIPGLEPVYNGRDMSVFKNGRFMPRAAFYDKYAYLPVGDVLNWGERGRFMGSIIGALRQKSLDIENTLLLHDLPSSAVSPSAGATGKKEDSRVHIDEYSPTRVRLTVEAARPGLVFLSDNYFPGWEAFINGAGAKILRSWVTFRAVEVPAGKSAVVFSYRPLLLWASAALDAGIVLAWVALYRRRRPGYPAAARPEAIPKKKKNAPPPAPEDEPAADCGFIAERIVVGLLGSGVLFWAVWSAFVYAGGLQNSWKTGDGLWVNAAACAFMVALPLI